MSMLSIARHHIRKLSAAPRALRAQQLLRRLPDGDYYIEGVPYHCQFASPKRVADILEGRLAAEDDPRWRVFGYKTKEEAGYWAGRQCGISCVNMLLEGTGRVLSVAELTRQGVALGGYDTAADRGWYYKPLAALLRSHGIDCYSVGYLPLYTLAQHLYHKRPAIISVNPQIIRGDATVTIHDKGGHLVVALGFRKHAGTIEGVIIHNPSGKSPEMRNRAYIPLDQFLLAYGERGILVAQPYETRRQ